MWQYLLGNCGAVIVTDDVALVFDSIMPAKQIYLRSHKEIGEKLEEIFASNSEQKVILLLEGSTDTTGESWNMACQEGGFLS